jgi:acetyl/propionyl-CoA carboxylase alpha subunit
MIRKILIANRGEIACRIIRTCREMGIATVAVYSDADARALHVEMADEAVHLGASEARESYLQIDKIITAARRTGADAVHPGYGFLAENATFAQACINAGLIFIGPSPKAIEAMGSKRGAKLMLKGIPIVPGYMGEDQSNEKLITAAQEIGFPIMVKASAGGGGKGMRQVNSAEELPAALDAARREALQAFGDDTLILEKAVHNPRHIEVQIFGDKYGNIIALGERECTIQRRHQKIIEETPSTIMTPQLRGEMFEAAVSIGEQLGYTSAGTVEFLVDDELNYYFMEMNTRLQVEHPVTEETTGFDLVRWQIMVAEGHPLPDMDVYPAGHAIEARVYAEDPANGFLPAMGTILRWRKPDEVRVDSGIRSGDEISLYYDPMVAKIIAYGEHREGAIRRLDYALSQLQLLGLQNNITFLRRVLTHPDYLAGNITTDFIERRPELLVESAAPPVSGLITAAIAKTQSLNTDRQSTTGHYWRNNPFRPIQHRFRFGDREVDVLLTPGRDGFYSASIGEAAYAVQFWSSAEGDMSLSIDGHRISVTALEGADNNWWIHAPGNSCRLIWVSPLPAAGLARAAEGSLRAPMPGQIRAVFVETGQHVAEGTTLMILEAMKMEHQIKAPYAGEVKSIHYQPGQTVQAEAILIELADTARSGPFNSLPLKR